jgi:dTDP-4-amino-4,6-dideoxygalactose transaminase
VLSFGDLLAPEIAGGLFLRFYGKEALLFSLGRGALSHAAQGMGLANGDNILLPCFHCGVEVEALVATGVEPRFYPLNDDLSVDPERLSPLIDGRTRGVLLIHYFGFPQPVTEVGTLCRSRGIPLIEDCCHALFSRHLGKPLGSFGEIAVFSQRKSLPLPDGGALLLNGELSDSQPLPVRPSGTVALKKALGMLLRSTFGLERGRRLPFPLELMNRLIVGRSRPIQAGGPDLDLGPCRQAMSGISRRIMDRTRIDEVVARRQAHYEALAERLRGCPGLTPLKPQLPEGCCPLYLPVLLPAGVRDELQERLAERGIHTFVFGADLHPRLPRGEFPLAERYARDLLCLPVHQQLTGADIDYLAATLPAIVQDLA